MPRIRTIKPEMWQDEKLAPLAPTTRLVFLALISMADDDGRLVDNVKAIDGFMFSETDDTSRDSIETLARIGRVLRYRSESGQKLIQIANWARHQKVDNRGKYTLPAPKAEVVSAQGVTDGDTVPSRESRESLATSSLVDLRPTTYDLRPTTPISLVASPCDTTTRIRGAPLREPRKDPTSEYPPEFEAAWDTYPKRAGGNSKRGAYRAWCARVRSGVDAASLLDGTRAYAAYCTATAKTGTEFVKSAETFYGPGLHYAEPWIIPPPRSTSPGATRHPLVIPAKLPDDLTADEAEVIRRAQHPTGAPGDATYRTMAEMILRGDR